MDSSARRTISEKNFLDQQIDRLFIDHPNSLGESYWTHHSHAMGFGIELVRGGLACIIHAVVPGLFAKTASTTVHRLHARMTSLQRFTKHQGVPVIGSNVPQ
jgi:Family of unknown function (DUF6356)